MSEDTARPLDAEIIVHLSSVPGRFDKKVFLVGPFASRLSFYRQQNRALNLTWALGRLATYRSKNVAVIGAGLAGVTAAAGLRAIGCSVTVYEIGQPIMPRQRRTSHRFVHPNLNYWPEEDLNPTTHFPFYNWVADDCVEVASDIQEEWIQFQKHLQFHHSTTVKSLTLEENGIGIKTHTGEHEAHFDYVILATGFEDELHIDPILRRPYWTSDDFSPPRIDEEPIFVSGTGDGGLIDALRLSHQDFAKGRLIAEAAEHLFTGSTKGSILEGERRILLEARQRADRARTSVSTSYPRRVSLDDTDAVLARRQLYLDQFKGPLPDEMIRLLEASLNEREPSVILVSPLEAPFSVNAAPIHKLLLAYGLLKNRIQHVKGRIAVIGGVPQIAPVPSGISLNPERTILRHGAGFNLGLLNDEERKEIEVRQGDYLDRLDVRAWEKNTFRDPRFGPDGQTREEFVKAHWTRALKLSSHQGGFVVSLGLGDKEFHYQILNELKLGFRPPPATLFGLRFTKRAIPSGVVGN